MRKRLKWTYLKITWLTVLLCLSSLYIRAQQQFSFSQYMDNLVPVNPAYSSFKSEGSLNATIRRQWYGIHGAPATLLLNGCFPLEAIHSTAGFILLNDEVAIERNFELNLFYAKSIRVGSHQHLSVSINAGLRQYTARYSELDSNDPVARDDIREHRPNIGFGILYYDDNYFLGLSLPEYTIRSLGTASIQSARDFKNNYYFTGGYIFPLNQEYKIKTTVLIAYTAGIPMIADMSSIWYMKDILGLGINYRTNNDAAAIFTLDLSRFHIGYSYQFNLTSKNIGGFSNATQEVSLGLRFGSTK